MTTTAGMMYDKCSKFFSVDQGCNTVEMDGGIPTGCLYVPIYMRLQALRATTVTGPGYCSVTGCTCGTLRIDTSDGLPVELMEFSVEGDDGTTGGAGEKQTE